MTGRFDPNQMHFFYNREHLGSCDTDYIECPKLLELMKSDSRVASQILTYMNSLGDPVFPTEPGGYEAETDVSKVDIEDLYNTFMQEIDYSYSDFPDDFYVGGDYLLPNFEIFVGPVAEENVVESATNVPAKRYIKSFTADDLKAQLGSNYPKGGYLYIFKHGIGPGTIPNDVKVVKVKDLPNYYTAVWLDRFLTDEELKQYDIPDETRINDYLGRIGYCKKNGDVVPCEDITASTMPKPTVDSVLQMIADKKILFKNDVAYWSRGKGVLPKEYRDCIAQTEYAHWINEWSCEQAEKYGSRAYYDYDGETEVDSCSDIKAAVKAYSYTPSRKRCTNVTDEVLEYTKDAYPALYDELESKDIWVNIWSDGEYSLSYNSIKNPDNFLSDSVKQDFMQAMEDLFPGSFWGDLVDIDACGKVMASTDSGLKYADKVRFEDIYPTDRDIDFFFTSDDATYAKEVLGDAGDVEGLVGFSIEVSLPKDYNGDWQEALIYISPKTSDGRGGESDSDWTDITFDISDADMQSLVEQSWAEYKKRGWNDPDTEVTSSTKYFANMVNASVDEDGFEQLVDGPENDTDEYIEYGKYYVAGYLQGTYRGLMSDLYSDDFEEILSAAADMAGQGLYIEITNRGDGRSERYTPEDFEVAAEYGEYPDHIREDLAL